MAWPKHNKLVVVGKMAGTAETWSYSLKFNSVFAAGPDRLPTDWDKTAVTAALAAFHIQGWTHSECTMTGWRGYQMDETNHVNLDAMAAYDWSPGVTPTWAGAAKHPYQIALVVGLESLDRDPRVAGGRDPGRFGRVYLPLPGYAVTEGRISTADASNTTNYFRILVEALKNAMYSVDYVGEALVNVSNKPSGSANGTLKPVDRYRCGRVLDTMQSRRRQLLEEYSLRAA